MSYLFGTQGIGFWNSCMKQNVLSLCLLASPRELPRRKSPAERLVWIPTALPEHCEAVIPGKSCSLGGSGTRTSCWEGRGRKWAQNTNICTSSLLDSVFAGGNSKAGAGMGLWGQQEQSSSGEGTEGRRGTGVNLKKTCKGTAAHWHSSG